MYGLNPERRTEKLVALKMMLIYGMNVLNISFLSKLGILQNIRLEGQIT
jgi:hypothetical protein